MHRSVAPWNLGPLLVRELSVCRESVAFTTDIPGAKPLDQRLPRLRSAHQTSRMNLENRQTEGMWAERSGGKLGRDASLEEVDVRTAAYVLAVSRAAHVTMERGIGP
jgi:hypothetical protein